MLHFLVENTLGKFNLRRSSSSTRLTLAGFELLNSPSVTILRRLIGIGKRLPFCAGYRWYLHSESFDYLTQKAAAYIRPGTGGSSVH